MYLQRRQPGWIATAPAKLNLYLDVLGGRDDGLHELETLMVPVRLCDTISLVAAGSPAAGKPAPIELTVHRSHHLAAAAIRGQSLPTDRRNLVVRSLELLQQRSGCPLGAKVQLVKRIPTGAGLGGGSSNAAAALMLADVAWKLNWSRDRLIDLAAKIGSDVPFFLTDGPAIGRGRGERLETVSGLGRLHFVIVQPPVSLATADVYRKFDQLPRSKFAVANNSLARLVGALGGGSWRHLPRLMVNRLQPAAAQLTTWIDRLRRLFADLGVVAHQMTGSGSAYFGVCRNARQAAALAVKLRGQRCGVALATCSSR